ncbi:MULTISPECIES: hypothetical protein [unclassified Pseudomonas]|uniref:hypothetical protein n=1 Tax=unclassified Pseudomonas TaxID=196821 RepID=UPI002AC95130|nr:MULTISPECIES: hypothetical protein [unclassified Pseudomonas]MEB0047308.1 hypothetical protein [Pseudomonas sp. Dout3]MEB0096560.1 hypothetical protein [Pseudomonas sp. DC1.2]WPX60319.1 hypothetical protein RHM68_06695 [Pseudomonas sp. DC1.2]
MQPKKHRLSAEKSKQLTRLITITKTANMKAVMDPSELAKIIALVATDIGVAGPMSEAFPQLWGSIAPQAEYYSLNVGWFTEPDVAITTFDVVDLLNCGEELDEDFLTYLKCLTELHKRRRKYGLILQRQPLPTMVQVSPRALMEYGPEFEPEALASWLTWRKFFYDLDNRSAQETGYLFEPILASAIGGEPKSARERVVRRSGDQSKGRQVDCWKIMPDGTALAYELKLRVTIAASGQGRFAEELSFAQDCRASGVKPVLVVLDPTANGKLTGLQAAYREVGGEAYVGEAAWEHLEYEAGPTMAAFIERYVRTPVDAVTAFETLIGGDSTKRSLILLDLAAKLQGNELTITLGDHERRIERHEDPSLAEDDESDEDL